MEKIGKPELVTRIVNTYEGVTREKAKAMIDIAIESIMTELALGNEVNLVGFGKFTVTSVPEKARFCHLDNKEHVTPAHGLVRFKAGANLKSAVYEVTENLK